jgi:hypothetical protein
MENSLNALDSEPLINELGEVIKKKINDLLGGFSERYNMLEDTHNKIMNLPSVQYHLNSNTKNMYPEHCDFKSSKYDRQNMNEVTTNISNLFESKLLQHNLKLQEKIDCFDNKINEYNDKYETLTNLVIELSENSNKLTNLVVKLSDGSNKKSETLNSNVIISENPRNDDVDNEDNEDNNDLSTDDESLISECGIETENIKIIINEDDEEKIEEEDVVEDVVDDVVDDVEDEEEVEDENEEKVVEDEDEEEVEVVVEDKDKEEEVVEAEDKEEEVVESEENEEEEAEEDDDEEEEEDDEEEDGDDEEEEEVFGITINDKSYFTNDEKDGEIYEDIDDDIGDKVGKFKKGKAVFF